MGAASSSRDIRLQSDKRLRWCWVRTPGQANLLEQGGRVAVCNFSDAWLDSPPTALSAAASSNEGHRRHHGIDDMGDA